MSFAGQKKVHWKVNNKFFRDETETVCVFNLKHSTKSKFLKVLNKYLLRDQNKQFFNKI